MDYDIIIIGAGPAGATIGYQLARAGFNILILEKERLPRYKPCAGALAARVLDLLDYDISPVVEKAVSSIYFTYKFKYGHLFTAQKPLAYMVMRDKFDHLLAEKATQAGAEIIQEAKATDIDIRNDRVIVTASGNQFCGQIVVGADGSKSTVAKLLNLHGTRRLVATIQSEVYVNSQYMSENGSRMWIDIGSVPSGYAWMFPKSDHLSMGVGILQKKAYTLKEYFWKCLNGMLADYQSIQTFVMPLSIWGGKQNLAGNRVILIGDAAGITDPLTGEGIYYAIKSGIIAAKVISQCLPNKDYSMAEYGKAIKSEIGSSLDSALFSSAFFYAFSRLTHRFGLCNNNITTYFGEMMQTFEGRDYKGLWFHGVLGL